MPVRRIAAMRLLLACALATFAVAVAIPERGHAQSDEGRTEGKKTGRKADRKSGKKGEKKEAKKPDAKTTGALPGGGGATLVETFADWSAYTAQMGRSKICYALSQPKQRTPANLKDTPGYIFVSFRPADNIRNEVASVLNFDTKEGAPATLAIGNLTYELVTKGKNAWVKNPSEEILAIGTMTKNKTMTLQVTSAKGNKTGDRYSLTGFAQALDRAKRECPGG